MFVFVYSTESMESYLESYSILKSWIAFKAGRTITPVGYDEPSTSSVTMRLPALWIGTKSDGSVRGCPPFEQVTATSRSLPLKWAEVSSKTGDNISQVQEWLYEAWDVLKARERAIHIHSVSQLSNLISTKHCKSGTLVISLDTVGRCLRHGVLLKVTKRGFKQETPCFLFERVLLFCKVANKGMFSVKKAVPLNLAVLTDSTRPAGDYAFELHRFGGKDSGSTVSSAASKSNAKSETSVANSWQLLALGQADKDQWMDALTHAINTFSRDPERAKHYSSIKALSLSSRPIQRQGRRQIGLPWALLSTNASSGVPVVVDSITNYLNNPSTNIWGAFIFPGTQSEHKILSERVNRMDPFSADFVTTSSGSSSNSSGSTRSSSVSSSTPPSISPTGGAATGSRETIAVAPGPSSSPTPSGSNAVGHSVQSAANSSSTASSSNDKVIDMNGISPTTAAEFLLGFLNASPSFIPVGFFTFLMQSCQDVALNSSTGSQHLKTAFAMLPLPIFKTLARLMFNIQQSVLHSSDDSIILKVARYLIPILVKDTVEIDKLNNEKLLLMVQSMVKEADFIFSLPFELVPLVASSNTSSSSASTTVQGGMTRVTIGPDALASFSASSFSMSSFGSSSSPSSGTSSPISSGSGGNSIAGATTSSASSGSSSLLTSGPRPSIETDFFNPSGPSSSFSMLSYGGGSGSSLLDALPSGSSSPTSHAVSATNINNSSNGNASPPTASFGAEDGSTDSQSSISALLRGMSSDLLANAGGVGSNAGHSSPSLSHQNHNLKRFGNFGQLSRIPSDTAQLEGIGPLNSDQVMSRVARARAVMAELLDLLKSVEHVITAPEIEAGLQSLVITCNSLSRYSWEKYQEMIESDTLDEFVFLIEIFHKYFKQSKGVTVDKVLKSKQTRSTLASLCNDMQNLINQFNSKIAGLKGYDQARPAGDRPKLNARSKGDGPSGSAGLNSSFSDLDSIGGAHSSYGSGAKGSFTSRGEGGNFGSGSSELHNGEEFIGDLSTLSAKQWWSIVFGQHSLRAATEKFVSELLAVSRSSVAPSDSSSPGISLSSSVGASSSSGMVQNVLGEEGSGSQPGTPRSGLDPLMNATIHNSSSRGEKTSEYPLLELSEKEKKALRQFFDQSQTGFVNLLKFSQFLKAFGSITSCVESAIQLIRSPYYYGYLTNLEAVRLLETEEPGTYLFCFENNDPSNWNIHWIDDTQTHKSLAIDATPGEYVLKAPKLAGSSSQLDLSSSRPPASPRHSISQTGTPSSDSSTSSEANSGVLTSSPSPILTSPALSSVSESPSSPTSTALGQSSHLEMPKIEVTVHISAEDSHINSYTSLQAAIESRPHDWRNPLKTNLYSLPFFYGDISESEGMRALKNQPVGTYLMIFSAQKPFVLDCLYVTPEERVGHIFFTRMAKTSDRAGNGSTLRDSSPDDSSSMSTASGANDTGGGAMFFLGVEKDGMRVQVQSGETFENLSDALRHYHSELRSAFTQKKSSGHVSMGSVHEGSLEKLVAYLYDDVVDLAYITAFLLTYRSFTQPAILLEELMMQYRHLDTIPNGRPYQMRLVNFFKIWLSDFSWDLVSAQDTLVNIMSFVNSDLSLRFPSITKQFQNYASKVASETQQHQLQLQQQQSDPSYFVFTSPVPSSSTYDEPSKALEFSSEHLAQQMFSFEFELFSKIQPFELMGNGWMKADKQVRAPNIVRMVAKSNLLGSWVVSEILKESVLKKRAALIEHFIAVADESYKLSNFHSAMVVMSALHDASIVRLKLTWDKVSKKSKETLETIESKMDDEDNFAQYRTAYVQAPPPKLPYMGLVFRDLIHIEDGSPKHLPNGAINFHRCELIAEKLHMIKLSQQDRLQWPKNEDLWMYVQSFPKHPDPQSQYHRSLELEPRTGGGQSMGGSGTGGPSSPISRSSGNSHTTGSSSPIPSPSSSPSPPIIVSSSSGSTEQQQDGTTQGRRQSRVMVYTAASSSSSSDPSNAHNSQSNNEDGAATGGLMVPTSTTTTNARTPSPGPPTTLPPPTPNQSQYQPPPPQQQQDSTNPSSSPPPSSTDSGKWSGSKSGKPTTTKPSALTSVMGFMRKK